MADVVGKAKIVAELDNKQALDNLEKYRRRLMETGRSYDKLFKEDISRKFSENFRKGFEQGVLRGLEKGENQFYQLNRAVGIAASSLDKIKAPAQMAADGFMKLQRTGLKFQAAAGTIVGTVGDLAGGFYSLVGVVGAAAPALVALGSTMVGVGIGFVGVKIAMAGVSNAISTVWQSQTALNDTFRAARQEYINLKFAAEGAALSQESAALKLEAAREALARVQDLPPDNRLRRQTELAFKQADLQLRQAKHKSEESFRAVKKGIEATSAYQPLASLTAVQLEFVKFMVALRPQMQQLKKEVAEGFIPKLQESIQTLMKFAFPALKVGLKQVASAMGDAAKTFASAFKDQGNLINLASLFESSTKTIGHFGNSIKSAFGGLLSVLHAAEPLTERFATWVDKTIGNFAKNSRIKDFNGDLDRTFSLAGDVAARLGDVFRGVFDGVKNIIKATFPSGAKSGAGGVLLDFLDSIVSSFKKFTSSKGFAEWLQNTTTGAVEALKTVGKFLAIFTDLAGSKETREFWIVLRDAIPYVRTILENGQKAGEELASVLVKFTKIIAAVADAGAVITFFNTLNIIMGVFADILSSPAFQAFIGFIGHIHGPILALGAVMLIAVKGFKIFLGYVMNAFDMLGKFTANMRSAERSFVTWRNESKLASQAGLNFFSRLKQVSQAARDSRLLQLSRDAGVAKDRLAQLELQMLSNSRAATLYNDKTKTSIQYLNMNEAEALEMAVRYEQLAKKAGMTRREVEALNTQLLNNIQATNFGAGGGPISNQALLAGTPLAAGQYRAPYVGSGGGVGGGAGGAGIVPGGVGRPGFMSSVGGLFGSAGRGIGGAGIAGGIGMAATVGSSLAGLGSGVTSQTGMVIQSLAGVASMFGPTGMVIGGLMSVGSVIVDGIMAAEAERAKGIKEFRIITANMAVENLNEIQQFGAKAAQAGFVGNKFAAEALASGQFARVAQGSALGTDAGQKALEAFALSSKRAYDLSKNKFIDRDVLSSVSKISEKTNLGTESIAGALGSLASITKKSESGVLANLKDTFQGIIGTDALKDIQKTLVYDDKGQLTSDSYKALLKVVTTAATKELPVSPGGRPTLPGGPVSNMYRDTTRDSRYEMAGSAPDAQRKLDAIKIPKVVADAAKEALGTLLTSAGGKSYTYNPGSGKVDFKGVTGQNIATNAISEFVKAATGVVGGTISKETIKTRYYQGQMYTPSELLDLKKTNKTRYGMVTKYGSERTEEGYNVAGQYFSQAAFDAFLSKLQIEVDGKKVSAKNFVADKGGMKRILDIAGATKTTTGNKIVDAASMSDAEGRKALGTAGADVKAAAVEIGKSAAKFDGYGQLIADNTNKAIAYAIISNTAAGQKVLASGDVGKINTALNAEIIKLGLKAVK